jgi:hypothetical protein
MKIVSATGVPRMSSETRKHGGSGALLAVLAALALAAAAPAGARAAVPSAGADAAGTQINSIQATAIANREPKVVSERDEHPQLLPTASLQQGKWVVHYELRNKELAQVTVDAETGVVRESWTGYQVAWTMARGYPGAFGHRVNAPYVWLPLCALFLLGLVDWRRPWRVANLDLLVLLSFGISHFFFNRANIGVSVPLAYPPLLYLMGRMLWIGFRGKGAGLRPVWPAPWLLIAALALLGFRGGLDVVDSGVIDVGYAGVVGADRITDGQPLYGESAFPNDVGTGDTYGPANYYAYVPFEQALPWSGHWDDLPAARAAAIFFDLGTFTGLVLLGRRLRPGADGHRLGATLGFGWAAYPYAAFTLMSNSNDTLVALLLVAVLLVLVRPAARGATLALAGLTKFSPWILTPLMATYGADPALEEDQVGAKEAKDGGRTRGQQLLFFVSAFVSVSVLVMLQTLIDPGIVTFWHRTIASQIDRNSPFSVWGQVPSLEPLRVTIMVAVAALALLVAFRPRRKSMAQVAALSAALLIGTQLIAQHWFYLYLVWFAPLTLVALAALPQPAEVTAPAAADLPARSRAPASAFA